MDFIDHLNNLAHDYDYPTQLCLQSNVQTVVNVYKHHILFHQCFKIAANNLWLPRNLTLRIIVYEIPRKHYQGWR